MFSAIPASNWVKTASGSHLAYQMYTFTRSSPSTLFIRWKEEISYLGEISIASEGQSSPEADTRDVNDRNRHSNGRELMGTKVTTEGQADWLNQVVKQYGQSLKIQFMYIIYWM